MSNDRVEEAMAEWLAACPAGEQPDPSTLLRAHPDLADALRERLQLMGAIDEALEEAPGDGLRPMAVDRYGGFESIGEGGMGIVYLALDTDLNRRVALKVVRAAAPDAADTPTSTDPLLLKRPEPGSQDSRHFEALRSRFLSEAWITAGMSHPGILPVYELGQTPQGVPYYTMRYIRGGMTLATRLDELRARPLTERLGLLEPFLRICDAVEFAHAHAVVHRDLKPENVAIGDFGEVVVLDWGLARVTGAPLERVSQWQARVREHEEREGRPQTGGAVGTPGYMAPEAIVGPTTEVDETSDVYSLGAILFEILTGERPFEAREGEHTTDPQSAAMAELARTLERTAPHATSRDPEIPDALADLAAQALARPKEERPASVSAMAETIRRWQSHALLQTEVEGLLTRAEGELEAADGAQGRVRLRHAQRAHELLARVEEKHPEDERIPPLREHAARVHRLGVEEGERAARRRTLVLAGIGALAIGLIGALVAIGALEASYAREQATAERERDVARRLLVTSARDRLQEGHPDRALSLLSRALERGADGPSIRFLLRQAVSSAESEVARVHIPEDPSGNMAWAGLSPDGERLLTLGRGDPVLWQVPDSRRLRTLIGHEGMCSGADFSPDGALIATAGADGTARVWSTTTGTLLETLGGGTDGSLQCVQFDREAKRLVATRPGDGDTDIWTWKTGRPDRPSAGRTRRPLSTRPSPPTAAAS